MPGTPPYAPIFNYPNNKLYQYEAYPVLLSCNFIVDSTNGNGLGIRSLKGAGIANVFMETAATAMPGNYGARNPYVNSGLIVVQFQNQFNRYLSGFYGFASPLTGSPLTSTVAGVPNVITSVGTNTAAQWQAYGLPYGMTPAVGACFIATGNTGISGGGTVEVTGTSGITSIEVQGDPNQTLQNSNVYTYGGGQIVLKCLNGTTRTQPNDGTVISLNFYLSNSSVAVSGQ